MGLQKGTGFDREFSIEDSVLRLAYERGFHVSPTGAVFVDKSIREGIVVKMVTELLQMRLLIKRVLREYASHPSFPHYASVLETNQAAIKMIVNTTYGYINAGFSGRMPNSEIGDASVEYAREVLNESICFVRKEYPMLEVL